jgi:hypothetical protein
VPRAEIYSSCEILQAECRGERPGVTKDASDYKAIPSSPPRWFATQPLCLRGKHPLVAGRARIRSLVAALTRREGTLKRRLQIFLKKGKAHAVLPHTHAHTTTQGAEWTRRSEEEAVSFVRVVDMLEVGTIRRHLYPILSGARLRHVSNFFQRDVKGSCLRAPSAPQLSLDYSGKWDTVPGQDDGGAVNLLSMLERPSFCTLVS